MNSLPSVCFLCTGNSARSVMARAFFSGKTSKFEATSAGTLVLEGQPMSIRTRKALASYGLSEPNHLSSQFGHSHLATDLVVAMEPSHIFWIRRHFPEIAARTSTLPRLIRYLPEEGDIENRIAAMGLAEVEIADWEEVVDPAGGDQEIFDRCAEKLEGLINQLVTKIS